MRTRIYAAAVFGTLLILNALIAQAGLPPSDGVMGVPRCYMTMMQFAVISNETEMFWQGQPSVAYQVEFPCPGVRDGLQVQAQEVAESV